MVMVESFHVTMVMTGIVFRHYGHGRNSFYVTKVMAVALHHHGDGGNSFYVTKVMVIALHHHGDGWKFLRHHGDQSSLTSPW